MTDNAQFYAVYIYRDNEITIDAVEKTMDRLLSWYRINDRFWILYTKKDAEKLYDRLRPLVSDSGSLFICKLDVSDRQGWMTTAFWDWIREHTND